MRKRLDGTGTNLSVSHWKEHMHWVFGTSTEQEILDVTARMNLDEALPNIRCPILVLHGENDSQVPLAMAKKSIEVGINSPEAELKVFTAKEGGVEHCQVDNSNLAIEYMADWVSDVFDTIAK
jgi:predicted alpha/beta hydrolase